LSNDRYQRTSEPARLALIVDACRARESGVRILGVDLAAQAKKTGAVLLLPVDDRRWQVKEVEDSATDDALVAAATSVDAIGVDSPLGWPVAFVDAVTAHRDLSPWPGLPDRSTLTHRDTDRAVTELLRRKQIRIRPPLSVSANTLGSVAMRCALLQRRWLDDIWGMSAPRDGTGPLVEVYPAAALAAWMIDCKDYKSPDRDKAREAREGVVAAIDASISDHVDLAPVHDRCVQSDHVLDAVVCALVVLASKVRCTHEPEEQQRKNAAIEGWIHLPSQPLNEVTARAGRELTEGR
jgi:predicted nuclease with RNAse H fold